MFELDNNEIYLLKGTCVPITGYNRGIIYNLVHNTYYHIPKKYSLKLEKSRIVNPNIFSSEAVSFFVNKNLIIKIKRNQIREFPKVNPTYIPKKDIEHIILEVDNSKLDLLKKVIDKVIEFRIRSFEFVLVKDSVLMNNINTIIFLKNEIAEPKALNIDYDTFINLKDNLDFTSFEYLKLYSYHGNDTLKRCNNEYHYSDIEYWKMIPKKLYFNFGFFSESLYKHPIFNKMFFVDKDGYFRQTPFGEMLFYYQELNENTFSQVDTWKIIKNQCDVCMDCEYRHMCIDARLPTTQKESIWYFNTECNYNPYICEWRGNENWISVKQWREQNPEWKNYQKPK